MGRYFVAFWNVENLFAPEGFPGRPEWLEEKVGPDLVGWSAAMFARKIDQLTRIITGMNEARGPDLLGVCEVENTFVLDALVAACNRILPDRRYAYVHHDAEHDKRGIDTAFLFDAARLSVDPNAVFSHFVMRRTGTRDITQATFTTREGHELVALANHWPSRSGGPAIMSQGFRMTAGETLGYWHERIREIKGPDANVIALGDLNDGPADPSVVIHANATRERDDAELAKSAVFYNLSWEYLRTQATSLDGRPRTLYGSIYYKGDADIFDQILVSPALLTGRNGIRALDATARLVAPRELVAKSKNEGAVRFGLPNGDPAKNVNLDGFADHFPVAVEIDVDAAIT